MEIIFCQKQLHLNFKIKVDIETKIKQQNQKHTLKERHS